MNISIIGTTEELDHYLPGLRETLSRLGAQCRVGGSVPLTTGGPLRQVTVITELGAVPPCGG